MDGEKRTVAERILENAALAAAEKKADAAAYEKELLARGEEEAIAYLSAERENATARAEDLLVRRATLDRLEGKKTLLRAKKQAVEEVFTRAVEKLCAMEKGEYLSLVSRLLQENAVEGERVTLAKNCPLSTEEVAALPVAEKLRLTVESGADVCGGFVLSGAEYDKLFSFDALAEQLRERAEAEVARILFGENKA